MHSIGILTGGILFCLLLPTLTFTQSRTGRNIIDLSTSVNYYPELPIYNFLQEIDIYQDKLILNYLTVDSGTFVVENQVNTTIDRTNQNLFPSTKLGMGFGLQWRSDRGRFHEISLSRLSYVKSQSLIEYSGYDSLENRILISSLGYHQSSFTFAFRYTLGKYFGDDKSPVRLGISGAIEPVFFRYRRSPYHFREYPLKASIFQLYLSIIPSLRIRFSDKVALEGKVLPSMLMGSYEKVREENPVLLEFQKKGEAAPSGSNLHFAASLALRYQLFKPRKRRR